MCTIYSKLGKGCLAKRASSRRGLGLISIKDAHHAVNAILMTTTCLERASLIAANEAFRSICISLGIL
jgi:hypothetical protein